MAGLPDMVIDHIFRRLITAKAAVRMSFMSKQWEDVLSSLPVLNFDEGDDRDDDDKHQDFINILRCYLQLNDRVVAKTTTPFLVKLRLHMTSYSSTDADVVSKLLSSSMERSVRELDVSLQTLECCYNFNRDNFINATTLTSLNLEYVGIANINAIHATFPCLKTMSLKNIQFDFHALLLLVLECPAIEHLVLDSCSFEPSPGYPEISLVSPSLKSLEIKHCKAAYAVLNLQDLETLTVVSLELKTITLLSGMKLKMVNISGQCLEEVSLHATSREFVNVKINAPALCVIREYVGYLGFANK